MRTQHPTPTEVIAAWIPHDARWHDDARTAATQGQDPLRHFVTALVRDHTVKNAVMVDEFDIRSIAAVREDLGAGGLDDVDWRHVQDALLRPLRVRQRTFG